MTGANAKIKRIMIGDKQVRPPILEYDFTQTDGGWTVSDSTVSRGNDGFYINVVGKWKDKNISAPNEVYTMGTPKKITLIYKKNNSSLGTGFISDSSGTYAIFCPKDDVNLNTLQTKCNGTNDYSLGANPTGTVTWEINIDSSTTNWTVTHKITGCTTVTETSGALKYMLTNNNLKIRLVHWQDTSGLYIQSIRFEY